MRGLAAGLVAIVVLGACGGGDTIGGAPVEAGAITVESAWVRPTPGEGGNTAFYMTIENAGPDGDRLLGAEAAACGDAELHESTQQDGAMQMRPLDGGMLVPAGASIVLGPAGLHVMCLNVAEPLEPGEMVPLTLQFEGAGPVTVAAEVRREP